MRVLSGLAVLGRRKATRSEEAGTVSTRLLEQGMGSESRRCGQGLGPLARFSGGGPTENFAIVVDDALYCWGGFSYSDPCCYKDGYRLSRRQGKWRWDKLPDLPWPVYGSGICVMGAKIYLVGGADFDNKKSYTDTDRVGDVKRLGARLLVLDTKNLHSGWKELAACPGTPRLTPALAAVAEKLFLFAGSTGNDNPSAGYRTVVDNWRYDPALDRWQRIADMPVADGGFPSGRIVAFDRYVILVGGCQFKDVLGPDGSLKPAYGTPFKHYPDNPYNSDVFVYDAKLGRFGTATPLPLNNLAPMTVVAGDRIHLIGGETGGSTIEGERFGHHPDLYLVGTIQEVAPASATSEPIDIGSRLEPLVDDYLIETTNNLTPTLHEPTPREVVIVHDQPWEGSLRLPHRLSGRRPVSHLLSRLARRHQDRQDPARGDVLCREQGRDPLGQTKIGVDRVRGIEAQQYRLEGGGGAQFLAV